MDKETKRYFNNQDKKRIIKVIKESGLFLGEIVAGTVIPFVGPVILLDSIRHGVIAGSHITARRYDDLAVSFGRFIPGAKKTMSQSSNISKDMRKQLKDMNLSQSEMTTLMVDQIVLGIDREKRSIQDKKKQDVKRADGTDVTVFKQKYNTCTHSCNIGTLKKLHELGYINIDSIKFKKQSSLAFERFMADTMSKGMARAIRDRLIARNVKQDNKRQEYDMYVTSFRMTDREIELEDLIESLSSKKSEKDSTTISIEYLSDKEKKLSEEEKASIVERRKRKDKKYTRLAVKLMKKGMSMISVDGMQGVNTIKYVKEDSSKSVLSEYSKRKEQEVKRKSWLVENANRDSERAKERNKEHLDTTIQAKTGIYNDSDDIPI